MHWTLKITLGIALDVKFSCFPWFIFIYHCLRRKLSIQLSASFSQFKQKPPLPSLSGKFRSFSCFFYLSASVLTANHHLTIESESLCSPSIYVKIHRKYVDSVFLLNCPRREKDTLIISPTSILDAAHRKE